MIRKFRNWIGNSKTRSLKIIEDPVAKAETFKYEEELRQALRRREIVLHAIEGPDPIQKHEKYEWACNRKRGAKHEVIQEQQNPGCVEILGSHV